MPRMSKNHPMVCSIKKSDGYKVAYFGWEDGAFYLVDKIAKKKYGPFVNVKSAKDSGLDFIVDMGLRAGIEKPSLPAAEEKEVVAA